MTILSPIGKKCHFYIWLAENDRRHKLTYWSKMTIFKTNWPKITIFPDLPQMINIQKFSKYPKMTIFKFDLPKITDFENCQGGQKWPFSDWSKMTEIWAKNDHFIIIWKVRHSILWQLHNKYRWYGNNNFNVWNKCWIKKTLHFWKKQNSRRKMD